MTHDRRSDRQILLDTERMLNGMRESLNRLHEKADTTMALIDDIKAKETKLASDVAAVLSAVQTTAQQQSAQIAALQAQIAAGNPVTDADLQAVSDALDGIDATVTAAMPTPPAPAAPGTGAQPAT